jgi:hypothetical protein
MKFLILITVSILSLNVYSKDLGENQKSECIYANQDSRVKGKVLNEILDEAPAKNESKSINISK